MGGWVQHPRGVGMSTLSAGCMADGGCTRRTSHRRCRGLHRPGSGLASKGARYEAQHTNFETARSKSWSRAHPRRLKSPTAPPPPRQTPPPSAHSPHSSRPSHSDDDGANGTDAQDGHAASAQTTPSSYSSSSPSAALSASLERSYSAVGVVVGVVVVDVVAVGDGGDGACPHHLPA